MPFYFCQPHHPWQKPTVENTNGPIREFFPKGTDFSRVTDEEVQEVFEKINDRPRKVLGFRTANEVYRGDVALSLTIRQPFEMAWCLLLSDAPTSAGTLYNVFATSRAPGPWPFPDARGPLVKG